MVEMEINCHPFTFLKTIITRIVVVFILFYEVEVIQL